MSVHERRKCWYDSLYNAQNEVVARARPCKR